MTIRTIVTPPDPVLRRKARSITLFDQPLQELVEDMIETLRANPGVGLAAPQIGVSQRLIVVEYAETAPSSQATGAGDAVESPRTAEKKLYVIANPEISQASLQTVSAVEMCLSIPRIAGEVVRHEQVLVKGLNRRGQPLKIKASGWLARIFQHEVDHVNGVLFTDRAGKVWRLRDSEAALDNV